MEPAGFPERLVFVRNGIELFQAEDAATPGASCDVLSSVSPASHSPNIWCFSSVSGCSSSWTRFLTVLFVNVLNEQQCLRRANCHDTEFDILR